jgi:3-methylcrotonyl-CoA carboxylase alpha subunit
MSRVVRLSAGGEHREFRVSRNGAELVLEADGDRTVMRVAGQPGGPWALSWSGGRAIVWVGAPGGAGRRVLAVGGRTLRYAVEDTQRPRRDGATDELTASIPAVVAEVLVEPGQQVAAGERLVLLESMKMILPITTPRPGLVNAILRRVGDAVNPGQRLVEFTPHEGV